MAQTMLHSNRARWGFSLFIRPIFYPEKTKTVPEKRAFHDGKALYEKAGRFYRLRGTSNAPGEASGITAPR